jgi:hypothetical protein
MRHTIAKLYNPHDFDSETQTQFLRWIQQQVAPVKEELNLNATAEVDFHRLGSVNATPSITISHDEASLVKEAFWDHAFQLHHNIQAMYTAWEVESGIIG